MTVNGRHPATVVVHLQDTDAWVPQNELTESELRWHEAATRQIASSTYVSLESLRPAVTFHFDEHEATLEITASAESFQTRRIELGGPAPTEIARGHASAFVNYGASVGPAVSPRYQAELGVAVQGALLQSSLAWSGGSMVRGPVNLTYDKPQRLLRFEAGETRLAGFGASSSVGLLGLVVSRQLGMNPGLLRYSPLHLSGETAAPADVDVFVNGQLVQRLRLDAGPFELRNLNPSVGAGVAQVVIRDDYGRQQEMTTSFYRTARVLRRGLQEFTYGAGRGRREVFARSSEDQGFAAVAQHRRGVTEHWTLGGHASRRATVTDAGVETAVRLPFAELALITSHRRGRGGGGQEALLAVDSRRSAFSVGASVRASSRQFATAEPSAFTRVVRELNVYMGALLPRGANITVGHNAAEEINGMRAARLTVSTNRVWYRKFNVSVLAAYTTRGSRRSFEGSASVSVPLGSHTAATAGYFSGSGLSAGVQQSLPVGPGFGFRAQSHGSGGAPDLLAAEWQGDHAKVFVEAEQWAGRRAGRASVAGSVVVIDRSVHFGRPITDAFALIDLPRGTRVPVFLNNQYVGATDEKGHLLVPGLASYNLNELRIDPSHSPLDLAIDSDSLSVRPSLRGGALVRFATRDVKAVRGRFAIQVGDRTVAPSYGEAVLPGTNERSPLGLQGEFYFEHVPDAPTHPEIDYLGERFACAALPMAATDRDMPRNVGVIRCTLVRAAIEGAGR